MSINPTCTPYEPHGEFEHLRERFASIPRHLFRTWTPNSTGSTTSTCVKSEAAKNCGENGDLFSQGKCSGRDKLKNHMLWQQEKDDIFVSWTSSHIFAFQHGIRKGEREDPSTIEIMMIDTYALPLGVFLSAHDLLQAYDLNSDGEVKRKLPWFNGEFLSQGILNLPASATVNTTLAQLQGLGLTWLYCPTMYGCNYSNLYKAINAVRKKIGRPYYRKEPTDQELEIAQHIATEITDKPEFRPVLMLMLLSMKSRYCFELKIMHAFEKNGWGQYIDKGKLESYDTVSTEIPEHRQFVRLMSLVQTQAQQLQEIEVDQVAHDHMAGLTSQMEELQT